MRRPDPHSGILDRDRPLLRRSGTLDMHPQQTLARVAEWADQVGMTIEYKSHPSTVRRAARWFRRLLGLGDEVLQDESLEVLLAEASLGYDIHLVLTPRPGSGTNVEVALQNRMVAFLPDMEMWLERLLESIQALESR